MKKLLTIPIPSIISASFSHNGSLLALISLENKSLYLISAATGEIEYKEKLFSMQEKMIWSPADIFLCTFSTSPVFNSTGVTVYEKNSMTSLKLEPNSRILV